MFLPTDRFPFVAALRAAWPEVRAEYDALLPAEFEAWPETRLYRRGWDVYGLHAAGRRLTYNAIYCPATTQLLERNVPGLVNAGYSRLAPGTHIVPHTGYTTDVLRLHLTLKNTGNGGLRVGGQLQPWIEGECLVFDDTVEHEAWNHGPGERAVLLVDFLRPADGEQAA